MKSYLRPGPYPSGEHKGELALVRAVARQLGDIGLRFRTLFRRLGGGLDGPGGFGDADAWYCILEGPAEVAVAEAQARALVDLLASYAARPPSGPGQAGPGERREILLAVDEFSAVSRRLPVWQLYERARSLGLAVQVSAQSWPGLAADEDERYRIAASADGGIWLLRTPHPEPAAALAGTRKVTDTTRRLLGMGVWGHQGTSRMRLAPVVDPARVRALDVGQAAYIYRGGVTYVQVKRLVAPPAALSALGVRPGWRCPRGRAAAARCPSRPTAAAWSPGQPAAAATRTPARRTAFTPPPASASRCWAAARRGVRDGAIPVIGRGRRAPATDPFRVLGLKPSPDLTDSDVRAAWRRAASDTHPDREDGGDPERFAAAAAAYTALRTRFGRGEALADLGVVPPPARGTSRPRSAAARHPGALPRAAARLAGRARRGRPLRLALRILAAAAASAAAVAAAGPHPAAPALVTGVATWLVLTARHDLAPPR